MEKTIHSLSSGIFLGGIFLLIFFTSCATKYNRKPSISVKNQEYWLTTSLYAGNFYDDHNKFLVDFRPFSIIDDAKTLDGYIIYPHKPTKIIKAGTRVRITNILLPTSLNKSKRPLFSPKNNIWVYLTFAQERGGVNIFTNKTHILILPKKIKSLQQVKSYLRPILSKKDPTNWLLTQENHILQAIWSKRPAIGMTQRHLLSAMGPAQKITRSYDDIGRKNERWYYPDYFLLIQDKRVIESQKLEEN